MSGKASGGGTARVAGIVLAAGMSTRFGSRNKLLAEVGGVPIIVRTVTAYAGAGLEPVLVVTGEDAPALRHALAGLPVDFVDNHDYREGQSRSLVHGVRALPATVEAAVIGVADQPFLTAEVVRSLVERYLRGRPLLVAPRYAGEPANPILFDRRLFPELLEVSGDRGGRPVVRRHADEIAWVEVAEARPGRDVDTVADLDEAEREL